MHAQAFDGSQHVVAHSLHHDEMNLFLWPAQVFVFGGERFSCLSERRAQ